MIDGDRARLSRAFEAQRRAFAGDRAPALEARLERVSRLRRLVISERDRFRASLADDFGSHHPWLTDLMETGPVVARANHFLANLAGWLDSADIPLGAEHGAARGQVLFLPKGVMGNISPWNFAIESALVMCVDMLAAGNRVMIKPSELAPATAQAIAEAVASHFEPELLTVAQGGPDFSQAFAALPWDHLTFTGSPRVGRIIARIAGESLTPVTLELGGKNPALFAPDAVSEELVRLFLSFRVLKSGQVCTSPDHALVQRGQLGEWVALAEAIWRRAYPSYLGSGHSVGIINAAHFARLADYVEEARHRGVRVLPLNDDRPDPERRLFPLTLVIDPPADLRCMEDELFGPVVPVIPYDDLPAAFDRINAGPTPLGAYIATHDAELAERFVREVRSGGSAVNTFGLQGGHPALPFGGLGNSGQGCHGSRHGFMTYSHAKSVFWGAADSLVHKVLEPPLSELTAMAAGGQYANPDG